MQPHLLHVDLKRPTSLALGAGPGPGLLILSLVEWTKDEPTAKAVVLDHAELWEDVGGGGHDSRGPYELVEV